MSFLKKTNLGTPASTTPKLGGTLGAKKLGGGLKTTLNTNKTQPKEIDIEAKTETKEEETKTTVVKPATLGGTKKLGGGLGKKLTAKKPTETIEEVKEIDKTEDNTVSESGLTFDKVEGDVAFEAKTTKKPSRLQVKAKAETKEEVHPEVTVTEEEAEEVKVEETTETVEDVVEEVKEEPKAATNKKSSKSKSKAKKKAENKINEEKIIAELEIDETKRVSLQEMDAIMRPIVAPTTESWEQEKKDVLEALNNIKVEQDMTMGQVKNCLADLDELNFEILPKLHDAETMYDGTKQNYDTVKAIAIAKGNATNAEGRKAEGILACQNFITPSGAVVDLHQYMLLIEERYKFYQKIVDGVNFKKYSLVNYNNALKVESKNA